MGNRHRVAKRSSAEPDALSAKKRGLAGRSSLLEVRSWHKADMPILLAFAGKIGVALDLVHLHAVSCSHVRALRQGQRFCNFPQNHVSGLGH